MKKIVGELLKNKHVDENLKAYCGPFMEINNKYANIRLAMNYYTYYTMTLEDESLLSTENMSGLATINLIIEEKKRGKTILMSSHMFEEVEKTCDRVGIIRQGRMVSIEDIDTLKKSKQKIYIITFKNHQDAYKFQKESFTIRNADDNVVEVVIKHEINELISCLNNYELMNFDIAHQSLEEIFMQFYGGNQHVQ